MRVYLSCVLCFFIYSCANTTKPDLEEKIVSPFMMMAEAEIINDQLRNLGIKKAVNIGDQTGESEKKRFPNGHYLTQNYFDGDILYNVDLDFYYENDSLAQNAFLDIREHYNKSTDGYENNIFSSWESTSQRGFVVKIMLANKTNFYGKPVVEIKLIEDDNRKYREQ